MDKNIVELRRKNTMKNILVKVLKTCTIAAMASMVFIGGNISAEEVDELSSGVTPRSSGMTLSRNATTISETAIKKSSNGDAQITLYTAIGANDTVAAYVTDAKGNSVSVNSAVFRNTTGTSFKTIPYKSGEGVKGTEYYFTASLTQSSVSSSLTISYYFIP